MTVPRKPLFVVAAAAAIVAAACSHEPAAVKKAKHAVAAACPPDERELGCGAIEDLPRWVRAERLPERAVPGAIVFAGAGCTTCHVYLRTGSANLGAPELTAEGKKHRGIAFQIRHLRCPSCVRRGSPMPAYDTLTDRKLHQVGVFLEASKGPR